MRRIKNMVRNYWKHFPWILI